MILQLKSFKVPHHKKVINRWVRCQGGAKTSSRGKIPNLPPRLGREPLGQTQHPGNERKDTQKYILTITITHYVTTGPYAPVGRAVGCRHPVVRDVQPNMPRIFVCGECGSVGAREPTLKSQQSPPHRPPEF